MPKSATQATQSADYSSLLATLNRARGLALVLRIDPAVEPEFFRMKHPRRIPHLPKTQSYAGGGVDTSIAFEIVFCLVQTIIVKSPLLNAPRSLGKDCIIDFRQPPVIRIFESSDLKGESALGQDTDTSSGGDVNPLHATVHSIAIHIPHC